MNGARTILFEEGEVGGTCTQCRLYPNENLQRQPRILMRSANAGRRGVKVDVNTLKIDMPEIYKYRSVSWNVCARAFFLFKGRKGGSCL